MPAVESVKRAGIPLFGGRQGVIGPDYKCYVDQSNKNWASGLPTISPPISEKYGSPKGKVVELQGTPGNVPTEHRRKGSTPDCREYPNITIVATRTPTPAPAVWGDGEHTPGPEEIDAVYTHEGEIALGASKR